MKKRTIYDFNESLNNSRKDGFYFYSDIQNVEFKEEVFNKIIKSNGTFYYFSIVKIDLYNPYIEDTVRYRLILTSLNKSKGHIDILKKINIDIEECDILRKGVYFNDNNKYSVYRFSTSIDDIEDYINLINDVFDDSLNDEEKLFLEMAD